VDRLHMSRSVPNVPVSIRSAAARSGLVPLSSQPSPLSDDVDHRPPGGRSDTRRCHAPAESSRPPPNCLVDLGPLARIIRRAVKRCSALAGASPAWENCRFARVATEAARRVTVPMGRGLSAGPALDRSVCQPAVGGAA